MSLNQNIRYKQYDPTDLNNPHGFYGDILGLKGGASTSYGSGIPLIAGALFDEHVDTDTGDIYVFEYGIWTLKYSPPIPGDIFSASNLGMGEGLFSGEVAGDLQFKSLSAGSGVVLTPSATEISVSTLGGFSVGNPGSLEIFKNNDGGYVNIKKIKNTGPSILVIESPVDTIAIGLEDSIYVSTISQNFPATGVTVEGVKMESTVVTGATSLTSTALVCASIDSTTAADIQVLDNLAMGNKYLNSVGAINGSELITTRNAVLGVYNGALEWFSCPMNFPGLFVNIGTGSYTSYWGADRVSPADMLTYAIDNIQRKVAKVSYKILDSGTWTKTGGSLDIEVGYVASFLPAIAANFTLLGTHAVSIFDNPNETFNVNYTTPVNSNLVVRIVAVGLTYTGSVTTDLAVNVLIV